MLLFANKFCKQSARFFHWKLRTNLTWKSLQISCKIRGAASPAAACLSATDKSIALHHFFSFLFFSTQQLRATGLAELLAIHVTNCGFGHCLMADGSKRPELGTHALTFAACSRIGGTTSKSRTRRSQGYAKRHLTGGHKLSCWKKARQWFLLVKGTVFPKSAVEVLDYLTFLEQEVGTKSCVDEFMSALSVLEDAGQVQISKQLCKDRLVVAASKSIGADLKEGKTERKQAPTLSVAMLIALEIYVCASGNPKYGRCIAWACLICV